MYWSADSAGGYRIYTAPAALGPWTETASGTLPKCATSQYPCICIYPHPELSTTSRLVVSYYVPGYGPGVAGHPYPHSPINHVVLASIPNVINNLDRSASKLPSNPVFQDPYIQMNAFRHG